MHETWPHLCKKTCQRDLVGIATFPPIGLLSTKHILPGFPRKRSMLKVKYLKQRKIFEISFTESRFYTKYQTSALIREISEETGRNGSKSGVSRIIRESELTALKLLFNRYDFLVLYFLWSECKLENIYSAVNFSRKNVCGDFYLRGLTFADRWENRKNLKN